MNHLAHALLADESPECVLGALAADFIRPPVVPLLPAAVQRGVFQHRHVDGFTDRHPVVQRSIGRISKNWGWFSGIIIDVYYDHLLGLAWAEYAPEPLGPFVERVAGFVRATITHLPEPHRPDVMRFANPERLASYAVPDLSGIERAFGRISDVIAERMPSRAVRLERAVPELRGLHPELASDFAEFFPDLRRFAADWLRSHPLGFPEPLPPTPSPKRRGVEERSSDSPSPLRGGGWGEGLPPLT